MRLTIPVAAAALLLTLTGLPAWAQEPVPLDMSTMPPPPRVMLSPDAIDYTAVLASPIRTDEDRARDAARQTLITLDFIGVQPGWKVADMIMGGGAFTRTLSAAVGPDGHVTAWQPAEFIAFQASYGDAATAADALPNVDVIRSPIGAPEFPSGLNLVFTAQNYHDLHLEHFADDTAARVNAAVFAALKPGGYYVIIDHHAVDGADASVPHTLHRIDTERVIREVEAAGFQLAGMSPALWNDDDPRTASVFDGSIRGRTSQFMISFRKPSE
jgi:predicted methyltransferase